MRAQPRSSPPDEVLPTQETLVRAPFHRFLQLRLVACRDGRAEILLPFREELLANPTAPYIHGGVIASLLDIVGDYAVASQLGHSVPTIDMRVDFLRPAGQVDLLAQGRVVRCGRSVAVADAEVHDPTRKLVALGRFVYGNRAPSGPHEGPPAPPDDLRG